MNKKISSLICFALIITLSIPIISIAFAGKPDKGPLEKIVFIHYKKGYGKPEETPGKPQKADKEYYTLLVKGAKWKETPVNYVINPTLTSEKNQDDLSVDFITGAIFASAEEWDSNTDEELFHDYSFEPDNENYFVIDYTADWDSDAKDGRNEISFGNYHQDGVIAVAIVWGYFGGPPSGREIIEFDIMFDTDFTWGDAEQDHTVMDLQNIATHEIGHGAGLGDLYKTETSDETMYGYSTEGETTKRDLNPGDIAGIQFLYDE